MGARVLVIDDDRAVLDILMACLELEGHAVTGVADGEAGVRAIEAADFDLVLTDFRMPGIDGVETARRIRAVRPGVRIVMITGHVERGLKAAAEAVGIERVLEKPLSLDEIAALAQGPAALAEAS